MERRWKSGNYENGSMGKHYTLGRENKERLVRHIKKKSNNMDFLSLEVRLEGWLIVSLISLGKLVTLIMKQNNSVTIGRSYFVSQAVLLYQKSHKLLNLSKKFLEVIISCIFVIIKNLFSNKILFSYKNEIITS